MASSPKNMPLSHVGHQGTFTILYAVSDFLNSDFIVMKKKEFVKGVFESPFYGSPFTFCVAVALLSKLYVKMTKWAVTLNG